MSCGHYGIGEKLEIGISETYRYLGFHSIDTCLQILIVLDALFHLTNAECHFAYCFWLTLRSQTIMFEPDFCQFVGIILAKGLGCPPSVEGPCLLGCPRMDIPCQLHAKLKFHLSRFQVAHIHHPETFHSILVGFAQFVADERWRYGAEPDIRAGIAQVAQVIVDAISAGTELFGRGRKLTDIGIVVVYPAECHIIGYLETGIIQRECFLVRDIDLRYPGGIASQGVGDNLPLCGNDVGKTCQLCFLTFVSKQSHVLQSSHANIVDGFIITSLTCTLGPVVGDLCGVVGKAETL